MVHPPLVPPPRPSLNLSEPLYLLNFLYLLSLQSLAASLSSPKKSTPLESSKSSLFLQNTRDGGVLSSSNLEPPTSNFCICLSRSVAEQHGVGLQMSTLDRQLCPVRRKPKSRDLFRGEVRELASGRIIQRLLPQVAIKRVSVEGGEPQTVMKEAPWGWSVSPDGKTIVSTEVRELDHRLVLRLDSVEDKTTNYHDLDPRASPPLAFAPDPKAVVYLVREKGVDNVVVSGFRQTGRNEPWEPARLGGVCCGGSRFGRLTEASPV